MGLFGVGSSYSRLPSAAARSAFTEIGGPLEEELADTPSEYFVLQAAGMLFACETGAADDPHPVRTMAESLARARNIMGSFVEQPAASADVLTSLANRTHGQLHAAAARVPAAQLVGCLNSYLHMIDNQHLQRKGVALSGIRGAGAPWMVNRGAPDVTVQDVARVSGAYFVMVMIALPVVGALAGAIIGSLMGDWMQFAFWGFMTSSVISYVGQRIHRAGRGR
jgi:hypothetical protein